MFKGIPCAWSASLVIYKPLQRHMKKRMSHIKNSHKKAKIFFNGFLNWINFSRGIELFSKEK